MAGTRTVCLGGPCHGGLPVEVVGQRGPGQGSCTRVCLPVSAAVAQVGAPGSSAGRSQPLRCDDGAMEGSGHAQVGHLPCLWPGCTQPPSHKPTSVIPKSRAKRKS